LREKRLEQKIKNYSKDCSHQIEGGTISQWLIHTICKVEEKVFFKERKWNEINLILWMLERQQFP
jgi:hypothetical protein